MKVRLSPGTARVLSGPALRALAATWRIRTYNEGRWRAIYERRAPHVFLLWHEALLPLLWQHRAQGIAIVVSEARDGQYLTDVALSLGYRAVRGSSTRGATRALLGAVRELRAGHAVAFTPDGPRGPRRQLKAGAVAAAQRAGAAVIPLHATADRLWRLHSWDRFMIPKPGSRLSISYGEPFEVAPGDAGLAAGVTRAEQALAAIAGAAWQDEATPTD
ncbi:MAG: lysophospholipid acyltransferase family protein [Gemmatimonadales bacterium]|nr:lysophospholipid acyltransferase family protein [Gemmatimonadales bacterium]